MFFFLIPPGFGGNITVNQLVDILRGSKNQKTQKCGWDRVAIYGQGKSMQLKVRTGNHHSYILNFISTYFWITVHSYAIRARVECFPNTECFVKMHHTDISIHDTSLLSLSLTCSDPGMFSLSCKALTGFSSVMFGCIRTGLELS